MPERPTNKDKFDSMEKPWLSGYLTAVTIPILDILGE